MALEKIIQIPREEAEEGIYFLRSGLPEESVPVHESKFFGYYSLTKELNGRKAKLIYEPIGAGRFSFRNALYLE